MKQSSVTEPSDQTEAAALLQALELLVPHYADRSAAALKTALADLLRGTRSEMPVAAVAMAMRGNGHDTDVDVGPQVARAVPQPAPPAAPAVQARPGPKPGRKATASKLKRREPVEERMVPEVWSKLHGLVVGGMKTLGLTPVQVARAAGLSGAAAWRYLDPTTPPAAPPPARVGDALRRWFEREARDWKPPAEAGAPLAPFRRATTGAGAGSTAPA